MYSLDNMCELKNVTIDLKNILTKEAHILRDNFINMSPIPKISIFKDKMIINNTNVNSLFKKKKKKLFAEDSIRDKKGIYLFVMNNDFVCSTNFDNCPYSARRNLDSKKKPYTKFECISKKPLYIGKTISLQNRIKEHYSSSNKKTYSLKLESKFHMYKHKTLANYCDMWFFELKEEFCDAINGVTIYDVILSIVEANLHDILPCYMGSTKVN